MTLALFGVVLGVLPGILESGSTVELMQTRHPVAFRLETKVFLNIFERFSYVFYVPLGWHPGSKSGLSLANRGLMPTRLAGHPSLTIGSGIAVSCGIESTDSL